MGGFAVEDALLLADHRLEVGDEVVHALLLLFGGRFPVGRADGCTVESLAAELRLVRLAEHGPARRLVVEVAKAAKRFEGCALLAAHQVLEPEAVGDFVGGEARPGAAHEGEEFGGFSGLHQTASPVMRARLRAVMSEPAGSFGGSPVSVRRSSDHRPAIAIGVSAASRYRER